MFRYILSLFLGFLVSGAVSAQGWERVYAGSAQDVANAVAATPDGGYVMVGYYNAAGRVYLLKVDADGNLQWTKTFPGNPLAQGNDVVVTQDGGYAIVGWIRGVGNNGNNIYLLKTNSFGDLQWAKTFGGPQDDEGQELLELADGSLVIVGSVESADGSEDLFLMKTDPVGNPVWQQMFGQPGIKETGTSVALTENGDLIAVGDYFSPDPPNTDVFIVRVNSSGQLIWTNTVGFFDLGGGAGNDVGRAVLATDDGNFVIAGTTSTVPEGGGFLLKMHGNGSDTALLSEVIPKTDFHGLAKDLNGGFFVSGFKNITVAHSDLYLARFEAEGDLVWEAVVGKGGQDIGYDVIATPDGGAIAAGLSEPFVDVNPFSEVFPYLVKTDANGQVFTSYLSLNIFRDQNDNCQLDPSEPAMQDWILKIEAPNFTRYVATNEFGWVQLAVDTGTYQVQLITPNDYWEACSSATTVVMPEFYDTLAFDIPVKAVFDCPRNEVDVATPVLRRCADNTYTVRYCNSGTSPSENTTVEVVLDDLMTFTSSSLVPFQQVGSSYFFNIGTLDIGECGTFTVTAFLACSDTEVGQTHCVTAHITPDSFCNILPCWDGSIIQAVAKCDSGQVVLSVKNIGTGALNGQILEYVVVEDIVMLTLPGDPQHTFSQLAAGEEKIMKTYPANGSTYRIITEQSPCYPGVSYPVTAAIEGCKTDTSTAVSYGFYTMFPEGDDDPFIQSDCQESEDTDYNIPFTLKRGHPKGYDVPHYVSPQTDLDYLIHFENTGNDTVHQVIIRDTLSALLDPATVTPGAASHPYDFQVYGPGIVQFTIPNVNLLPGSSANAGFVKFRVSPKPLTDSTECGLLVLNSAAIYFDFNAPVQSNQTFHTLCPLDSFVIVLPPSRVDHPDFPNARLEVYPNPFTESAQFEISGVNAPSFTLALYDIQGRLLFNQTYDQPTFRLHRHQLPAGTLFYRLAAEGKPVASGKILVR